VPIRRLDWPALAGGTVLTAAAIAAYSRTFAVPLLFDDDTSVANNPTIRHLGTALWPPADATVSGRPVLNLSFAVNYAISGTAVWSYHAANLAIHILAGLTLFGIIRRTLARRAGRAGHLVAFSAALIWTVHPLLTGSVTYVVQRAESLMGLFYLLTLYCFIRGAGTDGPGKRPWYALSVAACLLGMGTKEAMASAPLVVLLYDRTFLAGSFRGAFERRRWEYAGLASTWVVLAGLALQTHGRAGTVGYGGGVSLGSYALTQFPAIVHYLGLSVWPHSLIFDYGNGIEPRTLRVVPSVLIIAGLAGATAWALARRPVVGFLGACFFVILAPSSSVVPVVTETIAEHRMYLPLIPVVVLAVIGIHRWMGRLALPLCLLLAAGLCWMTWHRNEAYRSAEGIWADTVAKLPDNERAHFNLGCVLQDKPGRLDDAAAQFAEVIRLRPDHFKAHFNLGSALESMGRAPEAIVQYEEALRLKPDFAEAHNNLGNALKSAGRLPEAIAHYEEAVRLRPDYAEAQNDLGCGLEKIPGRVDEAVAHLELALRLRPDFYQAHFNLGNTFLSMGRTLEAAAEYEEAVRLKPDDAAMQFYLAGALLRIPGRADEAEAHLKEVLRLQPGNDRARQVLDQLDALRR
jgi:Flp pilus assembly protein TadD